MCGCKTSQTVRKEEDIQDQDNIQEQFILVRDPMNDPIFVESKSIEILLAKDGTMPMAKLDRRFPGVHCLEYTNPETGRKRAVEFDEKKKAFLAPLDGWGDKIFTVLYKEPRERPKPVAYY